MWSSIPIIINNRDRLTTTRRLAERLKELRYENITILDNASTYAPLLQWYKECPFNVRMLNENVGQLAGYNRGEIGKYPSGSWVVYTDSDIELSEDTPHNFISYMALKAEQYHFSKIGLALKIDDLPDAEYPNWVKGWESKYWEQKIEPDLYIAHVDTTFCLVKAGLPFSYSALRLGGRYTAKHIPWYLDYSNLSEEEQYVVDHSSTEYSSTSRFVKSRLNQ